MLYIDKWAGLVTDASPYALPPGGAVSQVNLQILSPGQLTLRPGTSAVSFTTHTGASLPVMRMFRYPSSPESIVYQTSDGGIRVGRGPQ